MTQPTPDTHLRTESEILTRIGLIQKQREKLSYASSSEKPDAAERRNEKITKLNRRESALRAKIEAIKDRQGQKAA